MGKILPKELLAKPNNLESLQALLEKYVDNINTLNQEAIFEFVREEFSIIQKVKEIKMIYENSLTK